MNSTRRSRLGLQRLSAAALALGLAGAAQAQTVLKFGYGLPPTAPYGTGAKFFAEELEKRSGGRFKAELFPNFALGGERDMTEGVQLGTIGVLPTPMAWPEVFGALQQGAVDGQEKPIGNIAQSKRWQVQKHVALTGHLYSPTLTLMSPAVCNKLSDADKAMFRQLARDAFSQALTLAYAEFAKRFGQTNLDAIRSAK